MMLLFLKEKITSEQSGLCSDVVPVAGLEPARPRALDFETSTSTDSITPASPVIVHDLRVDFKT